LYVIKSGADKRDLALTNSDFYSQHGPRNMDKHSKWPIFMRMHGSVMPKMILPILFVGAWSTFITCFCKYIHNSEITKKPWVYSSFTDAIVF
jgi:hypothetical protein